MSTERLEDKAEVKEQFKVKKKSMYRDKNNRFFEINLKVLYNFFLDKNTKGNLF